MFEYCPILSIQIRIDYLIVFLYSHYNDDQYYESFDSIDVLLRNFSTFQDLSHFLRRTVCSVSKIEKSFIFSFYVLYPTLLESNFDFLHGKIIGFLLFRRNHIYYAAYNNWHKLPTNFTRTLKKFVRVRAHFVLTLDTLPMTNFCT